jgi:hypothetical protein
LQTARVLKELLAPRDSLRHLVGDQRRATPREPSAAGGKRRPHHAAGVVLKPSELHRERAAQQASHGSPPFVVASFKPRT